MDEQGKRAIETAVEVLGEQSREVLMVIYRLGVVDGKLTANERAISLLQPVAESLEKAIACPST